MQITKQHGFILYIIFYNILSFYLLEKSFDYFYAGRILNACQSHIKKGFYWTTSVNFLLLLAIGGTFFHHLPRGRCSLKISGRKGCYGALAETFTHYDSQ